MHAPKPIQWPCKPSKRINAKQLITQRSKLDQFLQAYDMFGKAADTKALKVIIEA